ncbi:MAG: hypothetical protein CMC19_05315 [Flavobacteriaceae bacterium]|nr:hypothetical protein [Flavobacteriaceae bacterium]
MKTFLIGKNSTLYNKLKKLLSSVELIEKSHKELSQVDYGKNIVVFSYDPKSFEANRKMLDFLLTKKPKKLIYISTTAIYSNHYTDGYVYPRIKKEIENYLIQYENVQIIRVGMVEGFFDSSKFFGWIKYSSMKLISKTIKNVLDGKTSLKIVEAWESQLIENAKILRRMIFGVLVVLEKLLKSKFHYTRPLDLILKILGEQNYGYTFTSNQFNTYSKHTIIGSGMAALGVSEALDQQNKIYHTRLIHAKTSKIKYHELSSPEKSIESIENGGNSNLWHSVISNFLDQDDNFATFRWFFENLYPNSIKNLQQPSFSFIPIFPIRPLKKLTTKKKKLNNLIDDTIIYIEKNETAKILIHGIKSSYTTENLYLCTGSISSLKLLSDSGFIKTYESTISDHLVGYFGQFRGPLRNKQIIRTLNGHFKKFHEIKLNNRSLYVTLRPANFDFKDITKANEFRNFFGRSSKSIYISLLSKINPGLVLEALYNKFGIEFNLSGVYNIVGHIESKNTVSIKSPPFTKPTILYNEKEIIFSDEEIELIKNYLKGLGVKTEIIINKKTPVSPGLHFLNSNLKEELSNLPKGLKLFSTILFKDESPKHPTFDLMTSSYDATINSNEQ